MCVPAHRAAMGYACPVCEAPQADGEHLANHLAFTAMLHDDDAHADFLDARVEDWEEKTPPELAAELVRHADSADYDAVFEDTTDDAGMGHDEAPAHPGGPPPADAEPVPDLDGLESDVIDDETRRAIEEADKLFRHDSTEEDV